MADYKFTQDWFHWAPDVWLRLVPMLPARRKFLEIGSFEGRSTVWTVEHMVEDGGSIICIDPWPGPDAYSDIDMVSAEALFDHNVGVLKQQFAKRHVSKMKGCSSQVMAGLISKAEASGTYDFIYVDGAHDAPNVLIDACMSWSLLKPGGVMVFDDYLWGEPKDILNRPKLAVDSFLNVFAETAEVVHVGYQLVVRKR
jgi:predicted O-methyltransferase YrrM